MPIGTPVTLGTSVPGTPATSFTHSTSAITPAGSQMFVTASAVSQSASIPVLALAGGPGGWSKDKEVTGTIVGVGMAIAVFRTNAVAQVNSATTLTLTTGGISCFGANISAHYNTGVGAIDTGVVDGRFRATATTALDTQNATAPTTSVADTYVVGAAFIDNTTSATITGPATELHDFTNTNAWTHVTAYLIRSTVGAARIQGTWAAISSGDATALVAYKSADISVENASIGTAAASAFATTIALTTTATVAAGSFVVLAIGNYDGAASDVVTGVVDNGPGLNWVIDKQGRPAAPNATNAAFVSAQAPAGLASGTVITATFTTTCERRAIGGLSLRNVATSSPVDASSGPLGVGTAATGWTTPSTAIQAGSILLGLAYTGDISSTSTITSPSIEALDWNAVTNPTATVGYRIEATSGSYTVAGAFAAAATSVTVGVAYRVAGSPAPPISDAPETIRVIRGMRWT